MIEATHCDKILSTIRSISGNAMPWKVENGKNVHIPEQFKFLHVSNEVSLAEGMRSRNAIVSIASRNPQETDFDLIAIDVPDDIPFASKLLAAHGKLYIYCKTDILKDVLKVCHANGLFWAECRQEGEYSHLVVRLQRKLCKPTWSKQHGDVLLHCDWGWGDNIQFLRYAPLVKNACNGRVIIEARLGLEKLAATLPGVDEVVIKGSPLPPFDYHEEFANLHKVFRKIPKPPYLFPEVERNLESPSKTLRVGCIWHGHHLTFNFFRFYDPELLQNILLPTVELYGLQKSTDSRFSKCPPFMTDLSHRIHDWSDTANILMQMDLLVAIDTSIVHLAGALNIPTIVLMPQQSYNTPITKNTADWYPSMKLLFCDDKHGWTNVFEQLKTLIKQRAASRLL